MLAESSAVSASVKVAHLTSCHPPFDPRIFHRECCSIARAGYSITLVVPGDHDLDRDGVHVRSFRKPASRAQRFLIGSIRILRKSLELHASVYHIHDPDLILVAAALKLLGKRVIYDVHEDVPRQIQIKHWIPRWMRGTIARIAAVVERLAAWCVFDGIVAATPTIAARFPSRKTVVVRNFPELIFATPGPPYRERKNDIVYVGGLTELRGLREMMQAVGQLSPDLDARLILAGRLDSCPSKEQMVGWAGFERTVFLGELSRNQISELLSATKIGICVLHFAPNIAESYPTKVFEYMAAGLPVVLSCFLIPDLLSTVGCATFVDPQNTTEIASALTNLLANPEKAEAMGQAGLQAVQTRFNWASEESSLLALYHRIVPQASSNDLRFPDSPRSSSRYESSGRDLQSGEGRSEIIDLWQHATRADRTRNLITTGPEARRMRSRNTRQK